MLETIRIPSRRICCLSVTDPMVILVLYGVLSVTKEVLLSYLLLTDPITLPGRRGAAWWNVVPGLPICHGCVPKKSIIGLIDIQELRLNIIIYKSLLRAGAIQSGKHVAVIPYTYPVIGPSFMEIQTTSCAKRVFYSLLKGIYSTCTRYPYRLTSWVSFWAKCADLITPYNLHRHFRILEW